MVGLITHFNPSSRTNLPIKKRPKKQFIVYCSCGFQMSYDPSMDYFRCNKCRLCCTPQALVEIMRTRFK